MSESCCGHAHESHAETKLPPPAGIRQPQSNHAAGDACCSGGVPVFDGVDPRYKRVLWTVIAINGAMFLTEMVAGSLSGSQALKADALDFLGDTVTYGLSLAVIGASLRAKARVALFKGLLILGAAVAVAIQIGWRLAHPEVPIFEAIGIAAVINLAFNALCLWLLTPYRFGDVNMSSAWECSRNDLYEGVAVLLAAAGVWLFDAGWPDLVIAGGLLLMFLRSSARVLRMAWRSYRDEVK